MSRAQLRAVGISEDSIDRMVAAGKLRPEHRGVYAVGHGAFIPLAAETAALLACGEGAVLSHHSGAAVWELVRPDQTAQPVEVTVPRGRAVRRPGLCVHRTGLLAPHDIRVHQRLPVTSPARTLLDRADTLATRELERELDESLLSRILRLWQLEELLARANGRRGAPRLQSLLSARRGPTVTRSDAEERFLALVRASDLPHPRVNSRLLGYEVDFHWPEHRLVVEVDGYRYHSTRSAFERDRAKGAKLAAAGIGVMRVSSLQLEEEPFAVISRLAQALVRKVE